MDKEFEESGVLLAHVDWSHVVSALVRFESIYTLWRYVHPDAPVPLPPDLNMKWHRRL